jgi:hypothetical protein
MKKLLCVILALLVTACECDGNSRDPMTNEQIIEQTKMCNEAGLDAETLHAGLSDQTTHVQCKPRQLLEDKPE